MLLPRKTTWAIIGACFLAFLSVSEAKAESLAIQTLTEEQVYQSIGICDTRNTAQSFTLATSTWLTKIEFYGQRTSGTSTLDVKLCMEPYNSCLHTTTLVNATSTLSWIEVDYGTEAEYLPAGTYWVYFDTTDQWSNTCPSTPWSIHSTNLSGANTDYYPQGHATSSLGTVDADDDIAIRIYTAFDYEVNVEIIDNPDYDPDEIVEIWSEDFILNTKICYLDMSYGSCQWTFNYSRDYDNGTAYLLNQDDVQDRNNAIATTSLPLVPLRQASFIVPDPASAGTYEYCVFLEQATSTELLHSCNHIIKWYNIGDDITDNASSTDLNVIWKFVDRVTNVFPISLAKQIWSVFSAAKDATTTPVVLYLQDVMPDDGDTILGATNPPLLSYSLLKTYSYWDDIILRFMNYCVYLIGFFITIFLIFPALRGIDLGGHNKIPHTGSSDIETRKVWKGNFITGYRPGTESRKYVNTKSVGRVYLGKKWK